MHAMYSVNIPRSVGYQHGQGAKAWDTNTVKAAKAWDTNTLKAPKSPGPSPIHGMSVPNCGGSMIKLGNLATGVSHGTGSRH